MTENEAKEVLQNFDMQVSAKADGAYQSTIGQMACEVVIKALEELQQYRSIGTVEEIKQIKRDLDSQINHSNKIAEILKSTRNILSKREELLKSYCSIGTVSECRESVEKQKDKKPIKDEYNHDCCPTCGWVVYQTEWGGRYLPHCENCGQSISWECDNE